MSSDWIQNIAYLNHRICFENIAAEFNMTCHRRCSYCFKGGLQNYLALIGSKAIFMRSPADFCK